MAFLKTASINPDNIDSITDKIRNDINGKLSVSFNNAGNGLNFLDPRSHIQIPKVGTPSGIDFINKTQGGGWNLKTLVVFQGRPKVGKCLSSDTLITIRNKTTKNIEKITILEFKSRFPNLDVPR